MLSWECIFLFWTLEFKVVRDWSSDPMNEGDPS